MRRGQGQTRVGRDTHEGPGAGGLTAVELCGAGGGRRAGITGNSLAPGSEFISFSPKYTLFTFYASPGLFFEVCRQ